MLSKVQLWREEGLGVVAIDNGMDNALTPEVIEQLSTAVAMAESDDNVEVLCITGTGSTFFSAGVPWESVRDMAALLEKTHALASLLLATKKPTVSMIQAAALGGGVELSLLTDYRVVSNRAVLSFPEVNYGYHTVFSGHYVCSRFCSPAISRKLFMSGETFTAEAALNVGLVDEVFNSSNFFEEAAKLARKLPKKEESLALVRHSFIEPGELRLSFLMEESTAKSLSHNPSMLEGLNNERAGYRRMLSSSNDRASRRRGLQ